GRGGGGEEGGGRVGGQRGGGEGLGFPRQKGGAGTARPPVSTPPRRSLLRPQRGVRAALLLPWLEVRRRRQRAGDAGRAGEHAAAARNKDQVVSGARTGRCHLGVPG